MTGRERWLMCTDPAWMLDALGNQADERRKRLFASACRDEAKLLSRSHQNYDAYNLEVVVAYWLYAGDSHISKESRCSIIRCLWPSPFIERERVDRFDCSELAPLIDPRWRTLLVMDLARHVMGWYYEETAGGNRFCVCVEPNPDLSPILSDALQDSGCEVPEIIEHLKCGVHIAGECWLLKELLGL